MAGRGRHWDCPQGKPSAYRPLALGSKSQRNHDCRPGHGPESDVETGVQGQRHLPGNFLCP